MRASKNFYDEAELTRSEERRSLSLHLTVSLLGRLITIRLAAFGVVLFIELHQKGEQSVG